MALDTELVLERRRLRRRLTLWRAGAVIAAVLALIALSIRANGVSGLGKPQIARVSFEGTIVEDRETEAFFGNPESDRAKDFLSKILNH